MDTITVDGTEVPVRPITLVITEDTCAAPPVLDGHVQAGSWWVCVCCATSHQVRAPVHTFVTV